MPHEVTACMIDHPEGWPCAGGQITVEAFGLTGNGCLASLDPAYIEMETARMGRNAERLALHQLHREVACMVGTPEEGIEVLSRWQTVPGDRAKLSELTVPGWEHSPAR